MMALFLAQAARDSSEFAIIRLTDRPSWHTTPKLKAPENIRLIPQPARRPELNPVEHLWEKLRAKT